MPDENWREKRSRVLFPRRGGGKKQGGIDLEKELDGGEIDRVTAGASISRRANLAFDQDDDRARLFVRGEHEFARVLRLGATTRWQRASFEGGADRVTQGGGDILLHTPAHPLPARQPIYRRAP